MQYTQLNKFWWHVRSRYYWPKYNWINFMSWHPLDCLQYQYYSFYLYLTNMLLLLLNCPNPNHCVCLFIDKMQYTQLNKFWWHVRSRYYWPKYNWINFMSWHPLDCLQYQYYSFYLYLTNMLLLLLNCPNPNHWFTPTLRTFRSTVRHAENSWKRTHSALDRFSFRSIRNQYHRRALLPKDSISPT